MKRFRAMVMVIAMVLFVLAALVPFMVSAQEASAAAPAGHEEPNIIMVIMGIALAVSEGLALLPALKANGIVHMIILCLRSALKKPALPVVLLAVGLLSLTGCGKTLEQIKQTAHQAIDIGGKIYEDVKDNVDTVKQTLSDPLPAPVQ